MTITTRSKSTRGRRAGLVLAAAVALAGAVQVASASPAAAACTTNQYRVVWSQAPVYGLYDNRVIEVKVFGQIVSGPTWMTTGDFKVVNTSYNSLGKMHAASIAYIGCR